VPPQNPSAQPTVKTMTPAARNVLILAAASCANLLLLTAASHAPWWGVLPTALLFALANNTVFALLHECVHGVFAPNRQGRAGRLNEWCGRLAAAWFPTGLAVQRVFHLTHHRNNRSPSEQFDIIHEGDVLWLKYAQWYAIYTGVYWAVSVCGVLLYALTPRFVRRALIRAFGRRGGVQTGADDYIGALDRLGMSARLEVLGAALWQLAWAWLLGWTWTGWLACYAAFALAWSSLQYTDHAFSPLDTRNGAWNLAAPRWLRLVFLNYHLHLTHHRHPELPWYELPRRAARGPRFLDVWLACLRGPRRPGDFPRFTERDIV